MDDVQQATARLASLTGKQRAVLDLLCQHKSSKEIARTLGISPYTVDQRIAGARLKLGASNRGEVARAYAQLRQTCDESAYQSSHIPKKPEPVDLMTQAATEEAVFTFADVAVIEHRAPWDVETSFPTGLEAFDRRFGITGRFAAVVILAGTLAVILLAMVAMAKTLTELV
jgi:DNA-binding CsgD family transcriptional regulator